MYKLEKRATKPKVFVCYASEDALSADRLYGDLKQLGAEPWIAKFNLTPGQNWKATILKTIEESDYFIALMSHNSVHKKGYFQKELKKGIDVLSELPEDHPFLIPVRLEDCNPTYQRIGDLHWVDLYKSWDKGVRVIAAAMQLEQDAAEQEKRQSAPGGSFRVDLPESTYNKLSSFAKYVDVSVPEIIRIGVNILRSVVLSHDRGGEVVLREKDGRERVYVFPRLIE